MVMTAVSWVKTRGIALLFFLSTRTTASGFDEEGSPNCHFEIRLVSPIAPMSSAEAKPERLEPEKLLYFWPLLDFETTLLRDPIRMAVPLPKCR